MRRLKYKYFTALFDLKYAISKNFAGKVSQKSKLFYTLMFADSYSPLDSKTSDVVRGNINCLKANFSKKGNHD